MRTTRKETDTVQIGLIGLGRMGSNMRERWRSAQIDVIGYDYISPDSDVPSLEDLVLALPTPRIVWTMVPAGEATRKTITQLADLLDAGDLVIDGGNSHYTDDSDLAEHLAARSIGYLDCGVSGGVWGKQYGYGLMVGGDSNDVQRAMPLFDALRPQGLRDEGFVHTGPVGTGHFAKMVHNSIEYGLMQAYAEGYELLLSNTDLMDTTAIMRAWTKGTVVRSWLLELLVSALERDPQLADITGHTEDSGEGRWAIEYALSHAVPATTLANAVFARFRSRQPDSPTMKAVSALRQQFGGHATQPRPTSA
ncbi:phosphogluconate dehydrogenase (NAD(+)-dependent, decarboxylating) [Nocardia rhamnosiphila]